MCLICIKKQINVKTHAARRWRVFSWDTRAPPRIHRQTAAWRGTGHRWGWWLPWTPGGSTCSAPTSTCRTRTSQRPPPDRRSRLPSPWRPFPIRRSKTRLNKSDNTRIMVSSQNGRSQNGRVPKRPCVDQSGNLLVWNGFDYWFTHGRFGTRPFWERPFWHVTENYCIMVSIFLLLWKRYILKTNHTIQV